MISQEPNLLYRSGRPTTRTKMYQSICPEDAIPPECKAEACSLAMDYRGDEGIRLVHLGARSEGDTFDVSMNRISDVYDNIWGSIKEWITGLHTGSAV